MKKSAFLFVVTTLSLAGCGKNEDTSKVTTGSTSGSEAVQSAAITATAPNGRWFHNQLHCKNELPLIGPYDFSVRENELVYLGIADKGQWTVDASEDKKKSYQEFISANESCIQANIDDFELLSFKGETTTYSFAYSNQKNLMLRYIDGGIELIVPFDVEQIKKLSIIDNTEDSLPDEAADGDVATDEGEIL